MQTMQHKGKRVDNKRRIALFIDSDNISYHALEGIINELSKYGVVSIRQAYGNWTKDNLKNWEPKLLEFAIRPIQQFDYTKSKNATDILMTIDAMDLLHTKTVDAFAFATSDSDFTPVAMRVIAQGLTVYGFGEKKTPKAFMVACSKFIFTEQLMDNEKSEEGSTHKSNKQIKRTELRQDTWLVNLLRNAWGQTMDDDGWANLSDVGIYIGNNSSFSPISFGYKKLSSLIKEIDLFDIRHNEWHKSQLEIKDKRYKA